MCASAMLLVGGCTDDRVESLGRPPAGPIARSIAANAQLGTWSPVFDWPIIPAHMAVLPDLRVLTWTSSDVPGDRGGFEAFSWTPTAAPPANVLTDFVAHPNGAHNLFCSGQTFMPDGRLLVPGGHIADNRGMRDVRLWNTATSTWDAAPNMRAGRWYPTATVLANGHAVVVAGSDENASGNAFPEIWNGAGWRALDGAPLNLPYYPWMFPAADGRVFYAGPAPETRWLNPSGGGEWTRGPVSRGGFRDYGTAVTYAPGKILIVGGGDPPTATAEIVDLDGPAPAWQWTGSLSTPRRQVNGLVLPDGRVLVVGGSRGPGFNDETNAVLTAEVWSPGTGQWTTLAAMRTPRLYHATAVLLADGRVLVAGGGRCGGCQLNNRNGELFTPPYLFAADGTPAVRPQVTAVPASVAFGAAFVIATPEPSRIARVTLVRLPSTTHSFDQSQGFVDVPFTRTTTGLTATAPASPYVVPAGHYMLFALDAAGVPSVARVVQLTGTAALPAAPAEPAPPAGLAARATDDRTVLVTWSDQSGNETQFEVERCTGGGCTSFAAVGSTGADVARWRDSLLTAGTTYGYRVRARNLAGASAYSAVSSTTTSASPAPPPSTLVNRLGGRCLASEGGVNAAANAVLVSCGANVPSQTWTLPAAGLTGEVRLFDSLCLDVYGGSGNEGDQVGLWPCHGQSNQLWTRTSDGRLLGFNGRCVEPLGGATADGTPMRYVTCGPTSVAQQWGLGIPGDLPPVARFTAGCTGLQCSFSSSGSTDDRGIASRAWSYGDGTGAGDLVSALKTYASAGTYTVRLTVTDLAGQTASESRSLTVSAPAPNQSPVAAFTASCTDFTCTFVDGSSDPDGSVASWRWEFGNSATASVRNPPPVTYAAPGTYTVRLTVTDDRGATAVATRLVNLNAIALAASQGNARGSRDRVELRWSNANGANVNLLRNGALLTTTPNDGLHTDQLRSASGSYTYQLCETSGSRCSPTRTIVF